jgi:hypothetical protein
MDGTTFLPMMCAPPRDAISIPLFAGARDFLVVTKGFGPRPFPTAISSIERLEADESSSRMRFFSPSRANSSRCLIRSQFVRFSFSR